ncbi:MAG: GNAT family N-acetyltransferase [candidate division KSB1 bacterium]|nr:GNAT family N-acetyltransferase [candidate division KSB1 bacterium]MDZ7304880.1 GNAT family N-acetyltransferase [candidate division KSB1 bacterium]MDZ7314364.1 GNAT family N-acetyltransferase [candidate division KSB1 bacterium]
MNPQISIRTMAGGDIWPIVGLWNKCLPRDPINLSRFITTFLIDVNYDPVSGEGCYVAIKENQIVGFIRAVIRRAPNDGLGFEESDGWISVLFVDPAYQREGIGTTLLQQAEQFLIENKRSRVWVCGNTGSAPGYVFPGVDQEAYAPALKFFIKHGYRIDHEPVSMSGPIVDFDEEKYRREAYSTGQEVIIEELSPEKVRPFLAFLAEHFKGDWNAAARQKLSTGRLNEVLIAWMDNQVVGYCQWEGEHFGPFGVREDIRGKKIGAKLFFEAVVRIRRADGRNVWFNWADEDAARFYKRFGLKETRKFAILKKDL